MLKCVKIQNETPKFTIYTHHSSPFGNSDGRMPLYLYTYAWYA